LKLRFSFGLLLLLFASFGFTADRNDRIRNLAPKFMCICGCNQLLSACNHFNCPSSGPMLAEIGRLVDEGKSDDYVVEYYVDKYGSTVLSAPPASGFNLTAWIMPFAALGVGMLVAIYFARRFRAKWAGAKEPTVDLTPYQQKVEEELKTFTPED
jgi:cytochrome c-type biogenesis protein CcmH